MFFFLEFYNSTLPSLFVILSNIVSLVDETNQREHDLLSNSTNISIAICWYKSLGLVNFKSSCFANDLVPYIYSVPYRLNTEKLCRDNRSVWVREELRECGG